MTIKQIWNDIPCEELPWYHRIWVEWILCLFSVLSALIHGAVAMLFIASLFFVPYGIIWVIVRLITGHW